MKIAREYAVDIHHHSVISLFDEDIAGKSEAEIRERVDAMAMADPPVMTLTRIWSPATAMAGIDVDTMTDEEIHAAIQALLDSIRKKTEDTA